MSEERSVLEDDGRVQEEGTPWTRVFPPLLVPLAVIVAAVFVLPSALTLPRSEPSNVVEYAPVPPSHPPAASAPGDLESLALPSTATAPTPPPAVPLLPPPTGGAGARPNQKRCVGDPPRQTEDQQSPPCVPYFDGDNFGATYRGVTADAVNVLAYFSAGQYGNETSPFAGTYVDVDAAPLPACPQSAAYSDPKTCDHMAVRIVRAFARYFNGRFQTYGRRVHFWVYYSGATSSQGRRGDAAANVEKLRPFAVIDSAMLGGFNQQYEDAMAQLGALTFSSTSGSLPAAFYEKVAPLGWGFYPDVEHWAALYASYVCQKVVPFPVRRFGDPSGVGAPNGRRRSLGLWYTTDPSRPAYTMFARLVKEEVAACGAHIVEEATFSRSGFSIDTDDHGTEAAQAVARFKAKDVSTVLYMGGEEIRLSAAADAIGYYPEIVVAGDLHIDGYSVALLQNQRVWQNAWGTTFAVRVDRPQRTPAFRAYREGDPHGDDRTAAYAPVFYRDYFMLFQAIQVAGPGLVPETIDEGFHAIPEKTSRDPFTAAFFFDPGDHTAVKDAAEQWWDRTGQAPGATQTGCYRMVRGGNRSIAAAWAGADDAFRNRADPCNGYNVRYRSTVS
jgi:hypothetical protein